MKKNEIIVGTNMKPSLGAEKEHERTWVSSYTYTKLEHLESLVDGATQALVEPMLEKRSE